MARTKRSTAEDDENLGPAMQVLTDMQRNFVRQVVICGGDQRQAAIAAGYAEGSASVAGYQLAHNPRILAAIREVAEKTIKTGAAIAAQALYEIVMDRNHKDRMKAATELLNRTGMIVATKHEVEITDNRTADELRAYILAIADAHGLDPQKLVGQKVKAIAGPLPALEGEFEEVTKPLPLPEPAEVEDEDWRDDD